MTREEIFATTANDIEDWDSFMHISLIIAVESEFEMKEIVEMKNIGEIIDIILRETGDWEKGLL